MYAFTENEKIIKNYRNNLNIDYKQIKETIVLNKYNNEIDKFLKEKLSNLTKILTDYYDAINSTFSDLKNEIIDSINYAKKSMNDITEITKKTLNGRYQKISDSTNRIDKERTNHIERYKGDLKYVQKSENMLTNVTAYFKDLTEYGEFKLEFTLEGDKFKVPKIKAKIVDKTIPKKVTINILSIFGFCYYEGYQFDIDFNDASFTMTIEYDIKSSYINITSYKDIQKYEYTITQVVREGDMITEEIGVDNYIKIVKCVNVRKKDNKKIKDEVPTKCENESKIIDGVYFCIFCKKCDEGYFLDDDECIKKCEIGQNEKCNLCYSKYPKFCDSCNKNYFLPDKNNTECKKCEIENCLECIGNNSYTQCIKCENNYILSGGICLKNCEIGENNRCLKCSDEPGKINQCSICNNLLFARK